MLEERRGERTRWGRIPGYILTGIISCAVCGQAYTPASTCRENREYRYYRCSNRDRRGVDACAVGPLPAQAIEDFVVERVYDAFADGMLAGDVTRSAKGCLRRISPRDHLRPDTRYFRPTSTFRRCTAARRRYTRRSCRW
jgi:hypothetical protein